MFTGGTDASPTLKARARGGSAEYVLPPCAREQQNAAAFTVTALVDSTKSTACNITLNARAVSLSSGWHGLGTVNAPLISPVQVALVFRDFTPSDCTVSAVRLSRIPDSEAAALFPAYAAELRLRLGQTQLVPAAPSAADAEAPSVPCWRATTRAVRHACNGHRSCAFATAVLSDRHGAYAYALHRSLLRAGASAPLVVLAAPDVSEATLDTLARLGNGGIAPDVHSGNGGGSSSSSNSGDSSGISSNNAIHVHRLGSSPRTPLTPPHEGNATLQGLILQSFIKLEAWRLTAYRKVVLIDADTLVLRSIDALFTCP